MSSKGRPCSRYSSPYSSLTDSETRFQRSRRFFARTSAFVSCVWKNPGSIVMTVIPKILISFLKYAADVILGKIIGRGSYRSTSKYACRACLETAYGPPQAIASLASVLVMARILPLDSFNRGKQAVVIRITPSVLMSKVC